MSKPRPAICWPPLLGCLLAISAAGCQSYVPHGYGAYPGNYNSYPVYQPGAVVPYNGAPLRNSGVVTQPGVIYSQPGVYPQPGISGGYGPGGAPPFNPMPNPNYNLPPVNPNPAFGANPAQPGIQGVDTDEDDNFGQPGQFPPTTQRPKMKADDRFPVPDYNDPSQTGSGTPPAKSTNSQTPPRVNLGSESFQEEINGGKRATQKLESSEEEDDLAAPMTAIPKKSVMLRSNLHDTTANFIPPVNTEFAQQNPQGTIQMAQHLEQSPTIRPYGRASDGQAWFRGVVDFDEQEKTWYLIYNPQPDQVDELGGIITLLEHPQLQFLKSDDIVLVEGHFDQNAADRYGHSKYRIDSIKRLVVPQNAIE